MKKGQTLENITFEQAMELFKLPRKLDDYNGESVTIGTGKFGPYIRYGSTYVSIPKSYDPLTISFDQVVGLIKDKEQEEANKVIKKFDEVPDLEILNGRYGPYISKAGKNYKIPKNVNPAELTIELCDEIISEQDTKGTTTKRRTAKRK
jgi:DNA topoisomerase-1